MHMDEIRTLHAAAAPVSVSVWCCVLAWSSRRVVFCIDSSGGSGRLFVFVYFSFVLLFCIIVSIFQFFHLF